MESSTALKRRTISDEFKVKNSLEPKIVKTKLDLKQKVWKHRGKYVSGLMSKAKEKKTNGYSFYIYIFRHTFNIAINFISGY